MVTFAPKLAFSVGLFLALWVQVASSDPAARIEGVVVDRAGAAVSDAVLRLFSLERVRETRTDANGGFDFTDLPPGSYDLEVDHPGFKTKILERIQIADKVPQEFSITLQILNPGCDFKTAVSFKSRSDSASLRGIVNDVFHGPLNNATLTLTSSDSGKVHVTTSNDKGEFQLIDMEPGKYSLKVTHCGYWDGSATNLRIARENLTVLGPISILRKNEHQMIICQ
jgi:Carboxypeptidase regulatory-like domain